MGHDRGDVLVLPAVAGLGWSKIRALAAQLVGGATPGQILPATLALRDDPEPARRQLAVYLLGFTCKRRPEMIESLREWATDPSWAVQEALAQAFDTYCAALGYDAALPAIDAWLADSNANARRAVSEGLRPWTSKKRRHFADHPGEAIRRLAALRADESEYVRHSVGNALRDIRRSRPELVDAETVTWDLDDPREAFTHRRVLRAQ